MPTKHNRAGKSTYEMADKRRNSMVFTAAIGIAIFIGIIYVIYHPSTFGVGGVGILALLFLLKAFPDFLDIFLSRQQKEVKRAVRGADAEVAIDVLLDDLSDDYYVLNDLECPYGNIDHVVFSKNGGVFLIETKSHHGNVSAQDNKIYINGKLPEKDFIAQTLRNTYWLRNRIVEVAGITVWINSIIVFTNAFVPFTPPIKGIKIINQRYLISTIENTASRNAAYRTLWEKKENIFK